MSNMKRFKAALAAMLAALFIFCAGCAVPADSEVTNPPSSSAAPIVSTEPSPTVAATEKPAPTPTPEPMPQGFIDLDNCTPEQKQEADRIIQQFLNAEGPFTTAALGQAGVFDYNSINEKKDFYLGTLQVSDGAFNISVQEALLFTVRINGRFFLICGAEDKDRKRFINPVEVPIKAVLNQKDTKTNFYISTSADQLYGVMQADGTYWTNRLASKDMQDIIAGCGGYVQKPVYFFINGRKQSPGKYSAPKAFLTAANKRLAYARNFAASVYIPDYNRTKFLKYLKKVGKITGKPVTIKKIEDMYKADLNKTCLILGFMAYQNV